MKRASDLFSRVLIVGGAGSSDQSVVYPNALDKILGTRFKVIPGYRGSAAIALALERGEVMGVGGWNYSSVVAAHSNWLKDGKLNLLLQFAIHPHPALTDVPTVFQLAHNDRERSVLKLVFSPSEMGRAVFAPPGIPPKARKILQSAVLRDPAFLADARHSRLEINQPMDGSAVAALVDQFYETKPALVNEATSAIANKDASKH